MCYNTVHVMTDQFSEQVLYKTTTFKVITNLRAHLQLELFKNVFFPQANLKLKSISFLMNFNFTF